MATPRKKLAIIDGKSVFYRGYYAMPNLSTKDGTPTGGVYGFAAMALELIKRLQPDYVCVAWDKSGTSIRRRVELYPEYKAGRKPTPPDFKAQIPILHELLEAFGWPLYECDDYEADDIMGTLATKATKENIETMLITSDLDMLQLVNDHTHVYALKKGLTNIELFKPEYFVEKYGITVDQFIDLKALKGDSSDNIPGVPGIGEKTAIELLKQYKTLDGVYENVALTKGAVQKKLEAGRESAYLSKKIAEIWLDAPVELEYDRLDVNQLDTEELKSILQRLEFRSLLRNLPEHMQAGAPAIDTFSGGVELKLPKCVVIDSHDKLEAVGEALLKADQLVVHSRAAGRQGEKPQVLLVSPAADLVYVIRYAGLSPKHLYDALNPVLSNEKIKKIGHDIKATIHVLKKDEICLKGIGHDTQVAAFLINSLGRTYSLNDLAISELGYDGSSLDEMDADDVITRAPEIIAVIAALTEKQASQLKEMPAVAKLAKEVEWPVISVLADMEFEGIQLNVEYLKKFAVQLEDTISDIEQQIYGFADQEFNIASPSQLADILFDTLGLSTQFIKKGKTGYSTAASELDKLRGTHPIIDLITQYRENTKLKNTYVDTLPNMIDGQSRLHTTFSLTTAQTGRLSSLDPNLQNIPVRTELGRHIRTAFVAGEGNVLVSADYSQFELRLAAVLADDTNMMDAFNEDVDIHAATAAAIHGIDVKDVTKEMRYAAKAVNFGILYGQGPHGLAQGTGMSFKDAKDFIERYFAVRPKLKEYIEATRKKANDDGYVETMMGRRRPTPDVKSSNFAVREAAYRAAVNMPVQGSAADITKLAMIKLHEELRTQNLDLGESNPRFKIKDPRSVKLLLQIHDSILVECSEVDGEAVGRLMKDVMENTYELPVKIRVDVSSGKNWGEL